MDLGIGFTAPYGFDSCVSTTDLVLTHGALKSDRLITLTFAGDFVSQLHQCTDPQRPGGLISENVRIS